METQMQAKTIGASAGRREKKRNLAAGHHDQQCYNNVKRQGGKGKKNILRTGFEPVTYGCLLCFQLQSTALPTELSKAVMVSSLYNMPL